jgi:hypothetical protein
VKQFREQGCLGTKPIQEVMTFSSRTFGITPFCKLKMGLAEPCLRLFKQGAIQHDQQREGKHDYADSVYAMHHPQIQTWRCR